MKDATGTDLPMILNRPVDHGTSRPVFGGRPVGVGRICHGAQTVILTGVIYRTLTK
ncbi:MAG: hypothetical protein NTW75_03275 [Planctomycetales bacterium]|nr:hypothetical protein [Planctomycetales bacterium]